MPTFREEVEAAQLRLGLSQRQVADAAGISQGHLSKMLRGIAPAEGWAAQRVLAALKVPNPLVCAAEHLVNDLAKQDPQGLRSVMHLMHHLLGRADG